MAEKPNKNSNKLSFKDFYTVEYRPGEDESINYRAYRRKRTDEGWAKNYNKLVKDRGPTGIAYSTNPIHMKEIGKLVKSDKFKGNTSGLINHVKKNYPELHGHPSVQKAFQKHAETNESKLNELSAKTLSNYAQKAATDMGTKDYLRGFEKGQSMMDLKRKVDPKDKKKSQNRLGGIITATDKLRRKTNEAVSDEDREKEAKRKAGRDAFWNKPNKKLEISYNLKKNKLKRNESSEEWTKSQEKKKKQSQSDWERFQYLMKKSDEKHAAIKKKYQDNARNTALSKGTEFKPSPPKWYANEATEHSPEHIKQAIGIASDPRYAQGNMTGAVNAMNKLSKDIHKHPQVAAVLKRQNESKYTLDDILTLLGERYKAQSIANKRKASIRMRVGKTKHKAALGKKRAMRRMATQSVLKRRSKRQEWRNAFKKLAKGKKKGDMSISQIQSIEKKLERPVWQRIVNRKSVIGLKDKRRLEIARKKGSWKK